MTEKLKIPAFVATAFTLSIIAPAVSRADPNILATNTPRFQVGDTNAPPLLGAMLDTSYTVAGKAKFLGTKSGDSSAFNASLNLFAPLPLNEKWVVPLGLGSQNIFLNSVSGVPVDDAIHTLSFNTGLGYRLNDDWMIMGMFNPTLYKFSDVGGNDIGFSGGVNALWQYSPSLKFMFGIMVAPDSDVPVLPMVGVDWQIDKAWELRLMFPQPRLIYKTDDHWSYYGGLNLVGATFRSSDTLGTSIGRPEYNNALATYRDIRLGAGVDYNLSKSLKVEAEIGYSVSRQIDYTKVDETVTFDPAPYVRLGVNFSF